MEYRGIILIRVVILDSGLSILKGFTDNVAFGSQYIYSFLARTWLELFAISTLLIHVIRKMRSISGHVKSETEVYIHWPSSH